MSRAVSPKLSCYVALYYARVAQPVVGVVYEPPAIVAIHIVLSSQCLLKYDECHFK